jgi:hypothetical protein
MADQALPEFALHPSPSASTEAREAFSQILIGESAALLDRAMLLISELLANEEDAGATARSESLSVKVASSARSVRVEIRDRGTGMVLGGLRKHSRPASRGWSPHLLSRVTDRWGLVSGVDGAWIWFELDLPPGDY